ITGLQSQPIKPHRQIADSLGDIIIGQPLPLTFLLELEELSPSVAIDGLGEQLIDCQLAPHENSSLSSPAGKTAGPGRVALPEKGPPVIHFHTFKAPEPGVFDSSQHRYSLIIPRKNTSSIASPVVTRFDRLLLITQLVTISSSAPNNIFATSRLLSSDLNTPCACPSFIISLI